MKNYLNPKVCKKCGGRCCQRMPGSCLPADFNKDMVMVKAALVSGRYCIDWWEGDPRKGRNSLSRAYYIRPAGKGKEGQLTDPTWGNIACTFLTDEGCILEPDERPAGCRLLEPVKKEDCIPHIEGK